MFSVVIPYYKKRQYIERCLDSVLAQTYANYEIILVDDGSEDDITNLINSKYRDKVKLIKQNNQGVSTARNTGIANATQEFIAFLDADDFWSPYYLEKNSEVIATENDVKIVGSHYTRNKNKTDISNSQLHYINLKDYFKKQAIINTLFTSSSSAVRSSFFQDNSKFNSNLKRGEDIDVWLRVMASPGNSFYIENTLVYYSDEDEDQATKVMVDIDKTLVGNITQLYQPLFTQYKNKDFEKFVSKYIYFTLYPYFFSEADHVKAKQIFKTKTYSYFFLDLVYSIPFHLGIKVQNNRKLSHYLRLYQYCPK